MVLSSAKRERKRVKNLILHMPRNEIYKHFKKGRIRSFDYLCDHQADEKWRANQGR